MSRSLDIYNQGKSFAKWGRARVTPRFLSAEEKVIWNSGYDDGKKEMEQDEILSKARLRGSQFSRAPWDF